MLRYCDIICLVPRTKKQEPVVQQNEPVVETKDIFLLYYVPCSNSIWTNDPLEFKKIIDKLDSSTEYNFHLILHTLGGDPYSAAKIVNLIRSKCKKLTVIVPYWAMSAGTLIALGADEIVMYETGQLGPLDMQVQHPDIEKQISAYDYFNSASYVSGLVNTSAIRFYKKIREESFRKISAKEAVKISYLSSVRLFQPIIDKLDPVELNKCFRILDVSKLYGKEYLKKYSLIQKLRDNDNYAELLIGHLTYGLPDHSFGIFREEAGNYGLNVVKSEDYKYNDKVWTSIIPYLNKDTDGGSASDNKEIKMLD